MAKKMQVSGLNSLRTLWRVSVLAIFVELTCQTAGGQTQHEVPTSLQTKQSPVKTDGAGYPLRPDAKQFDNNKFPTAIPLSKLSDSQRLDPEIWRTANRCGVNSLYVLLRLYGCTPEYTELMNTLTIDSKGTSLQDLKEVASKYGRPLEVYKATPEALAQLLPAIVHREEQSVITGHFDVVVSCSDGKLALVNGTTGALVRESLIDFEKVWTGYVLTEARSNRSWASRLAIAFAAFLLGFASIRAYLSHKSHKVITPIVGENI